MINRDLLEISDLVIKKKWMQSVVNIKKINIEKKKLKKIIKSTDGKCNGSD